MTATRTSLKNQTLATRHPDLPFGKEEIVYYVLAIGNGLEIEMAASVYKPKTRLMECGWKVCPLCPNSRGIHETLLEERVVHGLKSGGRCIPRYLRSDGKVQMSESEVSTAEHLTVW